MVHVESIISHFHQISIQVLKITSIVLQSLVAVIQLSNFIMSSLNSATRRSRRTAERLGIKEILILGVVTDDF